MSLITDLYTCQKKLSPQFRAAIAKLPESTNPDKPMFDVIMEKAGGHETAHDVSLNKLKSLVDDDSVSYIEKAGRLSL